MEIFFNHNLGNLNFSTFWDPSLNQNPKLDKITQLHSLPKGQSTLECLAWKLFGLNYSYTPTKKYPDRQNSYFAFWSVQPKPLKLGSMLIPHFKALTCGYFWGKKTKDLFAKQSCHIHLNENWPLSVKGVYWLYLMV